MRRHSWLLACLLVLGPFGCASVGPRELAEGPSLERTEPAAAAPSLPMPGSAASATPAHDGPPPESVHEAKEPLPKQCVGTTPASEAGHTAACCYPAKEQLVRPLRLASPEFRRCYDGRKDARAGGRVVFTFRIEQDGHVAQACAESSSTFPDAAATRCILEVVTKLRYPSMSDEERRLCGLTRLTYPIQLEP